MIMFIKFAPPRAKVLVMGSEYQIYVHLKFLMGTHSAIHLAYSFIALTKSDSNHTIITQ